MIINECCLGVGGAKTPPLNGKRALKGERLIARGGILKRSLPIIGAKRQIVFALIVRQPAVHEQPISEPFGAIKVTRESCCRSMGDRYGDQEVEAVKAQRLLDCYRNVSQAAPPSGK